MHPAAGPKPDEAHPANPGHTRAAVQPMPSDKTGHRSAKSGSTYPTLIAGLVFLSGVLVAVIVHLTLQKSDREQLAARIKGAVDNRVSALTAATRSYEDSLHALRALYTFSNDISYAEFVGATRDTLGRYPGIGALEWAPLVAGNDRARIEAEIGRTVRSATSSSTGLARVASPVPRKPRSICRSFISNPSRPTSRPWGSISCPELPTRKSRSREPRVASCCHGSPRSSLKNQRPMGS